MKKEPESNLTPKEEKKLSELIQKLEATGKEIKRLEKAREPLIYSLFGAAAPNPVWGE